MGVRRKPPKTLEMALARSLDAEDVRKLRDAILEDALNKHGLTPPALISESRKLIAGALQRANVEYAATAKAKAMQRRPRERIADALAELHAHAKVAGTAAANLEAIKGEAAAAQALGGEALDLQPPQARSQLVVTIKSVDAESKEFIRKTTPKKD